MSAPSERSSQLASPARSALSAARRSLIWFMVGGSTLVASTLILKLTIARSPDPYAPAGLSSLLYTVGPGPAALPAITADLQAVFGIDDEKNVWIAGKNLFIAHSSDGGVTWTKGDVVVPHIEGSLAPTRQVAPNSAGLAQSNSWIASIPIAPEPAVPHENLALIAIVTLNDGAAIGSARGLYVTADGGRKWTYRGRLWQLTGVVVGGATSDKWVSVVDSYGVRVRYGGDSPSNAPAGYNLGGGAFSVSTKGQLERNGVPIHVPTRQSLNALARSTDRTAWAVGNGGVVLRTTDGGNSWHHLTRDPQRTAAATTTWPFLPPWYLIVNALSVYAFVNAYRYRVQERNAKTRAWIEPSGSSDRPLEPGDLDAQNLDPLAHGIADFLRNPETKPPLTIAITGAWGSGKSSLMNLVRCHLRGAGWRPVWFNAWHHQKEESLLAALLQTIRMQAVPRFWNRGGPSFYARLFGIRLFRYPARVIGVLMIVFFAIAFVNAFPLLVEMANQHSTDGNALTWLLDLLSPANASAIVILVSAISVIVSLFKALSAFGVKPAELLSELSSGARIKDLEAQTSFRERFAREFSEVTAALNPNRSMLIFIDDLDRCRPENVVEVLEAINFLVSSGECFVILGMARDKVQPAVGLAFEKMAAEMERTEGDKELSAEDAARMRRQRLASDYLDKLINIEVPVPRQTPLDSLRSLTGLKAPEKTWWSVAPLRALRVAIVTTILALLPLSMAFLGIELATSMYTAHARRDRESIKPLKSSQTVDATIPNAAGDATTTTGTTKTETIDPALVSSNHPAEIVPPANVHDTVMYWPVFLVLLLFLWMTWWLATSAEEEAVRDSDQFTKALEIWHPVLFTELSTPRAMKRFKNRIRFLAMRMRAGEGYFCPEHALVALSTILLRFASVKEMIIAAQRDDPYGIAYRQHVATFNAADLDVALETFLKLDLGTQFN